MIDLKYLDNKLCNILKVALGLVNGIIWNWTMISDRIYYRKQKVINVSSRIHQSKQADLHLRAFSPLDMRWLQCDIEYQPPGLWFCFPLSLSFFLFFSC